MQCNSVPLVDWVVLRVWLQAAAAFECVGLHARASRLPQLLADIPAGLSLSEAVTRVVGAAFQVRR